jgi:NitT/TauT family transport system ATP-binding protein
MLTTNKSRMPQLNHNRTSDPLLLCIESASVRFSEERDILAEMSLTVRAGEFVTLLGASGCGKSTLLNLTAGTLRPRTGTIDFLGKRVTSVNRNVGYVTQDDTMLPWLTLAANVALPLRMRNVPRAEVRERVMNLLTSFGLGNSATLYPAQLSGGMKKRGLLARALIYQPRLLLMDEPFAALDAQMRAQLQTELRRVVVDTGIAVLFVTHDLEEAALLSDRVLVIGGAPGKVTDEIAIPLGAVRDSEMLKFDDSFRDICRVLHESLQRSKVVLS